MLAKGWAVCRLAQLGVGVPFDDDGFAFGTDGDIPPDKVEEREAVVALLDRLDCHIEIGYLIAFQDDATVGLLETAVLGIAIGILAKGAVGIDTGAETSRTLVVDFLSCTSDADDGIQRQYLHVGTEGENTCSPTRG